MSVVVITGSTRGIGRGMAQAFAGAGHRVVISGRNPQEVAQAVAALPGSSGLACDVADPAQVYQCQQCGYESKTLPENTSSVNELNGSE